MTERSHFIDLRSFGAIGFQDAENGLWLIKQSYRPESSLLARLSDNAVANRVTVSAITTEDDRVLPGYPEDRFGFLAGWLDALSPQYSGEKIDDVLLRVDTPKGPLYWVNSQTISPPERGYWAGLKLHVVGANDIPNKTHSLQYLVDLCKDRGLLTFLCNVGQSEEARTAALVVLEDVTGIIGHDANNVFPFGKYSKKSNSRAEDYAIKHMKPKISVSSSHWMHEMGRAGIHLLMEDEDLTSGEKFLKSLGEKIRRGAHYDQKGYNSWTDVAKFVHLINKHGGAPDRFKGASSSYNH